MALTIRHLNGDSSFLLTFEPILAPGPRDPAIVGPTPFRILIDPWITGPSTVFHSKISISRHKNPACIASLQELPEPDLVVISQHKTDHCNEPTLRQLPATGTKTLILAEPSAARVIKSWKYFDREKIRTIPKWGDSGFSANQSVVRISVPPLLAGGEPGEVTVAFIPQRRDISGLHSAVGITYRPPASSLSPLAPQPSGASYKRSFLFPRSASPAPTISSLLTPPETPRSIRSYAATQPRQQQQAQQQQQPSKDPRHLGTPPTPTSPGLSLRSLRSSRSASSLRLSRQLSMLSTGSTPPRSLSLLYSPHGISTASLSSYVTAHLAPEGALPLTALLHCFDAVSNPWWLGGNILLGAPAGLETATALRARAWVSAHDGEKELRGIATALLKTKRYRRENIVEAAADGGEVPLAAPPEMDCGGGGGVASSRASIADSDVSSRSRPTEVLALGIGEQVVISNDGMWNAEAPPPSPLLEEPSESTSCCTPGLGCMTLNPEAVPIIGVCNARLENTS